MKPSPSSTNCSRTFPTTPTCRPAAASCSTCAAAWATPKRRSARCSTRTRTTSWPTGFSARCCAIAASSTKADAEFLWFIRAYAKEDTEITDPEKLRLVGLAAAERARWYNLTDQFKMILNDIYGESVKLDKKFWWGEYEAGRLFLEKVQQTRRRQGLRSGPDHQSPGSRGAGLQGHRRHAEPRAGRRGTIRRSGPENQPAPHDGPPPQGRRVSLRRRSNQGHPAARTRPGPSIRATRKPWLASPPA